VAAGCRSDWRGGYIESGRGCQPSIGKPRVHPFVAPVSYGASAPVGSRRPLRRPPTPQPKLSAAAPESPPDAFIPRRWPAPRRRASKCSDINVQAFPRIAETGFEPATAPPPARIAAGPRACCSTRRSPRLGAGGSPRALGPPPWPSKPVDAKVPRSRDVRHHGPVRGRDASGAALRILARDTRGDHGPQASAKQVVGGQPTKGLQAVVAPLPESVGVGAAQAASGGSRRRPRSTPLSLGETSWPIAICESGSSSCRKAPS
jgi:hypothetical protein